MGPVNGGLALQLTGDRLIARQPHETASAER